MDFLTPLAFLGGLLAIPIVLLYMLRLRRREVLISSTFLWRQVLQDQEANTPWQRLRRNLLLILQLLILAALVVTLARPFRIVPSVSAGQVTVLLDASASMNANDVDGRSRFDAAKHQALDIVDTLGEGHRMTVIRVTGVPEVIISSSNEANALRDAIRDAKPGYMEGDWEAALNLAAAGGAGVEDFTIVIIGDGGIPETVGLPGISGELRYIPVGMAGDNVAITALATRALPSQNPQLYAQITNYGSTEARVVFTLRVDGEHFDSSNETIPPHSSKSIISSRLPEGFSALEATLTQSVNSPAPDYLPLDDAAYAVFGERETHRVLLVTTGNIYLEQVLRSLPGLEIIRTDGVTGIPEGYDLYVFDAFLPGSMPDGDLLFIDPPDSYPPLFSLGEDTRETTNIRVTDDTDPLTQYVDVRQLNVLRFRTVASADWAIPLITADGGALLLAGEVSGQQIVILPFDLRETDLPLQIAWPVLMAKMVEWFTPRSAVSIVDSLSIGEPLMIHPPFEAESVRIIPPERAGRDDPYTLPVERDTVVFTETTIPGIYTLELWADEEIIGTQLFAVNLFSPLESDIAPVAETELEIEGTEIKIPAQEEIGQREFWPIVALLGLLILIIEWYAYHHRLRIPTLFTATLSGRPLSRAADQS